MDKEQLHSQFRRLGFDLPHPSIKRWSQQNLLPKPNVKASRGAGGGKGRASDWPETTIGQAAAIYAIRNQDYPNRKKRISPKTIETIRRFASTFLITLEEYRYNTDDPLLGNFEDRFYTDVKLKVPSTLDNEAVTISNGTKKQTLRPALCNESDEILAVKWITAVEKAALSIPLTTLVTIRYYFGQLQPEGKHIEDGTCVPLRYLFAVALRSEIDRVHVIAKASELEKLPEVVEDDAFLGAKMENMGWIRVRDTEGQGDSAGHLAAMISSAIKNPIEVGEP